MKNIKKIGIFCGFAIAMVGILMLNSANAGSKTPGDYLIDNKVSFLLITLGPEVLLTTYGWIDADEACKNLTNAGYKVHSVRNYAAESQIQTNAVCKN